MQAIQIIGQDLFDKIRSRFQNLEMGDKTGAVTIDPAEARFFDFDFTHDEANLGRVSISINDLGSLKVFYSQGLTENQDTEAKKIWYNFLKEMRLFAMRRLLRFDTRDVAKVNLDQKDFQYLAANGTKDNKMSSMNESKWNHKSSKKTSRAVRGTTEVIVRHARPVDEMFPASRSRRNNIKAIFIQNKDGERFKYPFIHPAGAFAMAQHVDHGGVPHDPAGKAIIKMSEQIAQLQEFQRQVQHTSLHDDAMQIKERAVGRLQELKSKIEALGKRHHYESWMTEFSETEHNDEILSELDPVTFEDYKSKFTQSNFNEELGKIFPLIHNIMQEKIDIEEYVSEEQVDEKAPEGWEGTVKAMKKHKDEIDNPWALAHWMKGKGYKSHKKADEAFEQWAEAVEQGKLKPEQIEALKNALQELESTGQKLELGPNGETAWDFFSNAVMMGDDTEPGFDEELKDKFSVVANEMPNSNAIEVFTTWAEENYPELLVALGMSQSSEEPAVAEPAPAASAPAAPSVPPPEQPVAEGKGNMMKEIAETVKRFYNASNEDVGPFRSEEAVCLEVEKTISEKYGESAGKRAGMVAKQFMEKLTKQWEMKHHKRKEELEPVKDDGLSRLKELLGNVKAKVENYSNNDVEEVQQKNFNPHDDLAGRGRLSSLNKTDAGKKADFDRGTERLKDKMTFTKSQGGVSGPKGPLPEMADILKLSGLKK